MLRYKMSLTILTTLAFAAMAKGDTLTSLTPTADAYVQDGGGSATNFGSATMLQLKWNSGYNRKAYIEYNLSGATSSTTTLTGATLSLPFVNSSAGTTDAATTYNYNVYGLLDSAGVWSESAITYANAPGNDATSGSAVATAQTTLLGTFSVTGAGIGSTFTISGSALLNYLTSDSDGLVTFIIVQTTNQDGMASNYVHAIGSKEGGESATLQVAVSAVPEPGSFALLATAFGIVAHVRRKGRRDQRPQEQQAEE